MKPDTRPTCASCGHITDGWRCADCPPDRVYCERHIIDGVLRIDAKGERGLADLCRACQQLHEHCKLCGDLTTHHTPNGTCPRCMRVVYMEAEALAREFVAWAVKVEPPGAVSAIDYSIVQFRNWLMRQREIGRAHV